MQREYKELLITDEMNIARSAKALGRYVVLCYPLQGLTEKDSMGDYPYAIENMEELDVNYLEHVICRFKGIPCHILDTARCRVREICVGDVDALYEIYEDPSITQYMENLFENKEDEIAYTRDYIRCHYGFYDYGMWIVEDRESGKIIGRAGFDMREGFDFPELGFVIRAEYQRRGIATEVCRALLSYGKECLGFEKVGAFTDSENIASVELLKRLGFVFRGDETVSTVKVDNQKLDYYLKILN